MREIHRVAEEQTEMSNLGKYDKARCRGNRKFLLSSGRVASRKTKRTSKPHAWLKKRKEREQLIWFAILRI